MHVVDHHGRGFYGIQIATTERAKHLPFVETELPPKKRNLATEALNEAFNN